MMLNVRGGLQRRGLSPHLTELATSNILHVLTCSL